MSIDAQNNKSKYQFDGHYQDQLKSALQNGSLAFRLDSEKTVSGEEGKLALIFDKHLLPEHCKLELIANALASLEKHPENTQLLNALGEYTKNSRYEQKWYSKMGTGMGAAEYKARFNLLAVGIFPLVAAIAFFSLPVGLIAAAACLFTAAVFKATSESLCSRRISAMVSPKFVRMTRLKLGRDTSCVRHALTPSEFMPVPPTNDFTA